LEQQVVASMRESWWLGIVGFGCFVRLGFLLAIFIRESGASIGACGAHSGSATPHQNFKVAFGVVRIEF